ncbi:MAG: hypothetical protein KDD50_07050 [Bdellovibrionales bacterium]|nr:hypothetical protein [Bdellovibrionales bacterium]
MKKQIFVLLASFLFLWGCNNNKTIKESKDTPETRLAAVKSHNVFHQLIQKSTCLDNPSEVIANCFFGKISRKKTDLSGRSRWVYEDVYLYVDESKQVLKSLHISHSNGMTSTFNKSTTKYTINGNSLEIADYGIIKIQEQNNFSLSLYQEDGIDTSSSASDLSPLTNYKIEKISHPEIYQFFCRDHVPSDI